MDCPHCKKPLPPNGTMYKCPACNQPVVTPAPGANVVRRRQTKKIRRFESGPPAADGQAPPAPPAAGPTPPETPGKHQDTHFPKARHPSLAMGPCGPMLTPAMTTARRALVDPERPGCFHLISRCVRRAFLCGESA